MHADNILVFIFCGKVNSLNQQIAAQKRAMNEYSGWATDELSAANMGIRDAEQRIATLSQQKKAAEQKQREAVKTNARRDELIQKVKNAEQYSGWATDELSAANMGIDEAQRKRKANLEELRGIDEQLGNIERPYDDRQRAGYTVGGALKNTGASIVEAGTTFADLMSKYNSQNPYLTETEIQMANAMNMTPDEYLKMRQRGGTEEARQRAFGKYYDTADRLMQESAHDIEVAKADLGKLGQAGVDLSVNLVQMGADAAGRAVGLGMLPFFTRAAGGSAYEARQEGASLEQRAAYGALKGAIEVGTEKLFDGVAGIFGKGTADNVVEATARKLAKTDKGRTLLRAFAGAAGEGTEEVISDILDPLAKAITYDKGAIKDAWENRKDLASDMLYDYLIGFAMGGLGAGGSIISGQDAAKNVGLRKMDIESEEMAVDQQNALEDIRAKFYGRLPDQADYMLGYATLDELNAADKARAQEAVQKNTVPESGTENERQDTNIVVGKLRESIPQIQGRPVVSKLAGNEFAQGEKKLSEQVADYFRSLGNKVFRNGLGDVVLDKRGIKSDIAHGMGRAKAITFAAVPDVIANGTQIDYQKNWKDRGYDTYIFAAPVELGDSVNYVAAVVRSDEQNRFYLHEVVDGNGNTIYIKKGDSPNIKTGVTAQDGITGVGEAPFKNSIHTTGPNVNNQFADNPAVNDPAGYMLGYYDEEQMRENAAKAREAAERAKAGNEGEYADLAEQYGTIPAGEKPFRESKFSFCILHYSIFIIH